MRENRVVVMGRFSEGPQYQVGLPSFWDPSVLEEVEARAQEFPPSVPFEPNYWHPGLLKLL